MRDPYLYPNSDVYVNVASIRNKELLKAYTAKHFTLSMLNILKNPIKITSVSDYLYLHKALFGMVFPWAGEIRTINIRNSLFILGEDLVEYADYQNIGLELEQIDHYFFKLKWENFDKADFLNNLANLLADIWIIHPLREGNTRTLIVFLDLFVRQYGYEINLEHFMETTSYLRNALIWGAYGELFNLKEILHKIVE